MARNKRTRQGTIDNTTLADDQEWEVEKILARAVGKQGQRYLVRWKGFAEKHDTWEPVENVVGAQSIVSQFNKDRDAAAVAEKKEADAKRGAAVLAKRKRDEVSSSALRGLPAEPCCAGSGCIDREGHIRPSQRHCREEAPSQREPLVAVLHAEEPGQEGRRYCLPACLLSF